MITAQDLLELADYDETPIECHASMEYAPNSRIRLTAPTRAQAEEAMQAFCTVIATRLQRPSSRPSRPS